MTRQTLMFTGDINLMNVADPAQPFARVSATLGTANLRFGNLECCLYQPASQRSLGDEGFYAAPAAGRALQLAGFDAVGNANNVNYGAEAIRSSLTELRALGIPSTGAGLNRAEARAPVIVEKNGLRYGFLQRTSVYWPTNHEAGEHSAGVAALRGHTAYQLPLHKTRVEMPPANRPGVPPIVVTWTDPKYLAEYLAEIRALREQVDVLVASQHWGLHEEVLDYMTEIAHAVIDAGADVVIGHGPHYSLPVELYKGKPVFYGLGSFSFHTGHGGRKHGDWVGMLARVDMDGRDCKRAAFEFVRHNDANETVICDLAAEQAMLDALRARSTAFATAIDIEGNQAVLRSK
ncbi:MAG: CapA family protein [Betaproteobacteria bacterium]|nr:CapA family protein [Betaproteobacteria bacterium]